MNKDILNQHLLSICIPTYNRAEYLADYKNNWYFYFAVCLLPIYFVVYGLIFLLKIATAKNYKLYHSLRKIKARIGI